MVANLSEEEQIEAIKRWWKENGTSTIVAIAIFVGGFFGWNYYKDAKLASAQSAAVQFQSLADSVQALEGAAPDAEDLDAKKATVQSAASALIEEQSSGLYADFARLQLAKLAVQEGELDEAANLLKKVKEGGVKGESQQLASLRLARVFASQEKFDEALAEINSADTGSAYASLFQEVKGDIYMMQQNLSAAATAYESALSSLPEGDQRRRSLVQFKIDSAKVASVEDQLVPEDQLTPEKSVINPNQSGEVDTAEDA